MTASSLSGRVAVVTGGGKGLGRAVALHLASRGVTVIVNNRNRTLDGSGRGPADQVVDEITEAGGHAVANHDDVTDPEVGRKLVDDALTRFGRLDFCITSAAVSGPQMLHRTTAENLSTVITTNVVGTALVAAEASRVMREAGFGRIVMIASTAGLHGEPTVSAYAASKGAVIALGRTAAGEGASRNVFTNVVLPYATTQMTESGMDPRFIDIMGADLVAPVVTALVDPESTTNGQVIVTAGNGVRSADAVEGSTEFLPTTTELDAKALDALLVTSRLGTPHTYPSAQEAFADFASELLDHHNQKART